MNRLPVVEFVKNNFLQTNLSKVCVVGHQHLLETTYSAFLSLFDQGLKPSNVHLMGKCYSTNKETFNKFKSIGANVSEDSFAFDSHEPYDSFFRNKMDMFFKEVLQTVDVDQFEKTIILDDGGYSIGVVNEMNVPFSKIVGVEQTTSGYEKVKKLNLKFPVINIARSEAKLIHETPMIADITIEKMDLFLKNQNKTIDKVLILGGGYIGKGIFHKIKNFYNTKVYDNNPSVSDILEKDLEKHLCDTDLIIGCTGTTSLPRSYHKYLNNCMLVSTSSSDREFDAVYIRKKKPKEVICHQTVHIDDISLANSGFPINFDGDKHSVAPEKIQLTRSLIILGIFQSFALNGIEGLVTLDPEMQKKIIQNYYESQNLFEKEI